MLVAFIFVKYNPAPESDCERSSVDCFKQRQISPELAAADVGLLEVHSGRTHSKHPCNRLPSRRCSIALVALSEATEAENMIDLSYSMLVRFALAPQTPSSSNL